MRNKKIGAFAKFCNWLKFRFAVLMSFFITEKEANDQGTKLKRKYVKRKEGLKSLLDNLATTFDSVKFQASEWSWTNRDVRVGLRRLGPIVGWYTNPPDKEWVLTGDGTPQSPVINMDRPLSSLMFVSMARPDVGVVSDDDIILKDSMPAAFLYALKLKKIPWDVERIKGRVVFECGAAWRDTKKKLVWTKWHTVLDGDGRVHVAGELVRRNVPVMKKGSRREVGAYFKKEYDVITGKEDWGSKESQYGVLAWYFGICVQMWNERDNQWTISVRKEGDRVTFCIPNNHAKEYFKDRDVAVLTTTGQKKKIMHIVDRHTRTYKSGKTVTIEEHLRGLQDFNWNGYECKILAPKFHRVPSLDFTAAGEVEDVQDLMQKEGVVYASKVGHLISETEHPTIH